MCKHGRKVIAGLALGMLSACGGSGGGGSVVAGGLDGSYALALLGGQSDPGFGALSQRGVLQSNGVGNVLLDNLSNVSGNVATIAQRSDSYSVDASGHLSFGSGQLEGGIGEGGHAAALRLNVVPGIGALLRPGAITDPADLEGVWHWGGFCYLNSSRLNQTAGGYAQLFSGRSIFFLADFRNAEGTVVVPAMEPGIFLTLPHGEVRVMDVGGVTTEGVLSADGEIFLTAGGTETGDPNCMHVFVRRTTGATNASLLGTYWVTVLLNSASPGVQWISVFGTATFDGSGGVVLETSTNIEMMVNPPSVDVAAYSVQADGKLETDMFHDLQGAVSASGRYAFAIGGTMNTQDTVLALFVRK